MASATTQAFANIAFIKVLGNRDGPYTRTAVIFQRSLPYDELIIKSREIAEPAFVSGLTRYMTQDDPGYSRQSAGRLWKQAKNLPELGAL